MVTTHTIFLMCLYGSLTGCIGSKWHWVRVVSQHIRTTRIVIHLNSNLNCILCIPCQWSECICKLLLLCGCIIWASTVCRWVERPCSIVIQDLIADIVSLYQIGKLWDLELNVISTVIANKLLRCLELHIISHDPCSICSHLYYQGINIIILFGIALCR